jgi:hypothetical protein
MKRFMNIPPFVEALRHPSQSMATPNAKAGIWSGVFVGRYLVADPWLGARRRDEQDRRGRRLERKTLGNHRQPLMIANQL